MSSRHADALGASIRQRLLNLSRERQDSFQRILDRFTLERFLYRLSRSPHASDLVLKGAYALDVWSPLPIRPTRDADFGGPPDLSERKLGQMLEAVCEAEVEPDAVTYDSASIRIEATRLHRSEGGYRASVRATLAEARSVVRIDVGLGDVVVPAPETRKFSSLLGLPAPALKVSPPEPMISEKLEAMIDLGLATSRMKDFYDIAFLAETLSFEGDRLAQAIRATFSTRKTEIPALTPVALTAEFLGDRAKERQWRAFLRASEIEDERSLIEIGNRIRQFITLPIEAVKRGVSFDARWPPEGPWQWTD